MSGQKTENVSRLPLTNYNRPGHLTARGPHLALWTSLSGQRECQVYQNMNEKILYNIIYDVHAIQLCCFYFENRAIFVLFT